ncbi:hypothetical protein [Actinomyces sp. oral taxon 181]
MEIQKESTQRFVTCSNCGFPTG